jgi:hypothetical protein
MFDLNFFIGESDVLADGDIIAISEYHYIYIHIYIIYIYILDERRTVLAPQPVQYTRPIVQECECGYTECGY